MPTIKQYLNEIVAQKKTLATNITSKGITASETELLNTLVPKVAQIENLKGEERTLENFTNVLSEPKSIVQLEYSDNTPKTLNAKLGNKNLLPNPYYTPSSTINGITFTANADGSISFSGTSTAQATFYFVYGTMNLKQGVTYTLSASGDYSFGGSSTLYIYDSKQGQSAYIPLLTDTSATFTPTGNINNTNCYIVIPVNRTVSGTLKPQLEIGDKATSYTPYISDFSTTTVTRCGKNLSHNLADRKDIFLTGTPTTVYSFTDNDIIKGFAVNGNATNYHIRTFVNNNGVITFSTSNTSYTVGIPVNVESGKTYTVSANIIGGAGGTAPIWISFMNNGLFVSYTTTQTFTVPEGVNQAIFLIRPAVLMAECTFSNFQLELGSTATEYEPYQGQSYTPTATGEVTGITNLYPLTNLITDNAGVVFEQVTGEVYKEILPSTDKNGITKVLQPAVDSTIDSNITSDNIKQGVSILGVTGDYICNYTYDETSKELVLLI